MSTHSRPVAAGLATRAQTIAAALLALAAVATSTGCGRTRHAVPEAVTPAGGGKFWVAGSEGYAAFHDGHVLHHRHYPRSDSAPDWAYEQGSDFPAARVVLLAGAAHLVTRAGDVARWDGREWRQIAARVPGDGAGDHPQVNFAGATHDGKLMLVVHPQLVLTAAPGELGSGRWMREQAPSFLRSLELVDGALVGVGWDESGNRPALHRRDPRGGWGRTPALWPDSSASARGAIVLGDGTPVAVLERSFVAPEARLPAAFESDLIAVRAATPTFEQAAAERTSGRPYAVRTFARARGQALVFLAGPPPAGATSLPSNVLELRGGTLVPWVCRPDPAYEVIGAFRHGAGWRVVTRDVEVFDLPGPRCRPTMVLAGEQASPAIAR